MRRREFITLLGGAVAVLRVAAAEAQVAGRMRRVAVLNTLPADDAHGQERIGAFLQALQQSGWSIGDNLRIDQRWAADDEALRRAALELVALAPDVNPGDGRRRCAAAAAGEPYRPRHLREHARPGRGRFSSGMIPTCCSPWSWP